MQQRILNLRPAEKRDTPPVNDIAVIELRAPDDFFHFTGHIRRMTRKGRFQYRFGRKVLPIDVPLLPTAVIQPLPTPSRLDCLFQPTFDL